MNTSKRTVLAAAPAKTVAQAPAAGMKVKSHVKAGIRGTIGSHCGIDVDNSCSGTG